MIQLGFQKDGDETRSLWRASWRERWRLLWSGLVAITSCRGRRMTVTPGRWGHIKSPPPEAPYKGRNHP